MLGDKPWPERLEFFTEWPRLPDGLAKLEGWLDSHPKAVLVVIDTLQHVRPQDKPGVNAYGSDYELVAPIQRLATKRRVAIVVITHVRKLDADDPIDTLQGTMGISGGVDTLYILKRSQGSLTAALLYRGR